MKKLLNYYFKFVENILPILDSDGNVKEFYPQESYKKKDTIPLNKYGIGAFCKFSVGDKYKNTSGVYALYIENELIYIGKCKDFALRFNSGYGNISPRNCYVGGQSTNCKINKVVLNRLKDNKHISIYFCKTDNYDEIEKELIEYYNPKYNYKLKNSQNEFDMSSNKKHFISNIKNSLDIQKNKYITKMSTEEIKSYIKHLIVKIKEDGKDEIILRSGEIHKDLNLKHSMPMVCSAMRSIGKLYEYEIIEEPPKKNGSRVIYKYIIK